MNYEELTAIMRDAGIVGAGGAGFPSYAKLDKRADTIILNCAECEPLLRLHRQLLERKAYEILQALNLIAKTVGAKQVIIGLKAVYKKTIAALEPLMSSFDNMRICPFREVYPAGDEVILIYEATGRVVQPGALPITVGVNVFNVETVYNLYRAINGKPVTRKYVTVTGEVKTPGTYYAPIGMTIGELIALSGGETTDKPAYLLGGPMMGNLGTKSDVVTKTTNAVIVLPEDHYVVQRKQTKVSIDLKRAMASCSQCRYCTDMCPRHLLGHPIDPAEFMKVASNHDWHNILPYLNSAFCSSCGLCEMYSCHQGLSPRNLLAVVKKGLRAEGVKPPVITEPVKVVKDRELKQVPLSRLRKRMDLEKYNNSAPISDNEIKTKRVKVMLNQHIGVPAVVDVKVGQDVKEYQVLAKAAEGKLSVNIHSPINGRVVEITEKFIIVEG
ncbi:MAG: SLBB domain-containing protein [Clostridiales bacterium]|nr:SLBB domain-containing protein [Clostridiales bacterium]